jgi:hypothetical protein
VVYFLVDRILSGVGACFLAYYPADNRLTLMNDSGTAWLPAQYVGASSSVLTNAQCSVSLSGSSATNAGTASVLRLQIAFTAFLVGTKTLYASLSDPAAASPWRSFGAWSIPGDQPPRLASLGLTPNTEGASMTISLSENNGFRDVQLVYLLVDRRFNGMGACFLLYLREQNILTLMNDAGNGWSAPITLGTPGQSVANSQCRAFSDGSWVVGSGNSLALTIRLAFPASFGGDKSVFVYGSDFGNNSTGWIRAAMISLPGNQPPRIESTTLGAGANGFTAITAAMTDANSPKDIETIYALVDRGIIGINACFLAFNRGSGVILLMNDAGTAWQGLVYPGLAGTASNSQCTIDGAGSSFTETASNVILRVAVKLSPSFSGPKSLFMSTLDVTSATSGWLNSGSWPGP